MENISKAMLIMALQQKDVYSKAIANFMFREVIEDACLKYNISQEDLDAMRKEAVNRAAVLMTVMEDPALRRAFAIEAFGCNDWEESEVDEVLSGRIADMLRTYETLAENVLKNDIE